MLIVEIYRRLLNLIPASSFLRSAAGSIPFSLSLSLAFTDLAIALSLSGVLPLVPPPHPFGSGPRAHARARLHMQSHLDDRTCRWFNDLSPTLSIYRRWRPRAYARKLGIQRVLIVSTHRVAVYRLK